MSPSRRPVLVSLASVFVVLFAQSMSTGAVRSLFKPDEFTSLGTLNATSGTITIDTNALTITGFGTGVAARSQSGAAELAVFTFESISLGPGVTINVVGDRGLVLGAKGDFYCGSTLNLAGGAGVGRDSSAGPSPGGLGGPGSEGGIPAGTTWSNPPTATAGSGGQGTKEGVYPLSDSFGHGVGGGLQVTQVRNNIGTAGGGGGYGGAGGQGGSIAGLPDYADGGIAYGDDLLTDLFGGSGGGGGRFLPDTLLNTRLGGGGGGGGAVELIAEGLLTVSGTIDVSGGRGGDGANICGGGGGSGGGVILAAPVLDVTGATILAKGGKGEGYTLSDGKGGFYNQGGYGGGGGGGRVAFYTLNLSGLSSATVDVSGGLKGLGQFGIYGTDGLSGTFRYYGDGLANTQDLAYPVPEPAAWTLLVLGAIGVGCRLLIPHRGPSWPGGACLGRRS